MSFSSYPWVIWLNNLQKTIWSVVNIFQQLLPKPERFSFARIKYISSYLTIRALQARSSIVIFESVLKISSLRAWHVCCELFWWKPPGAQTADEESLVSSLTPLINLEINRGLIYQRKINICHIVRKERLYSRECFSSTTFFCEGTRLDVEGMQWAAI